MAILLLRLTGPMQSWGTQSRFTHRDTGLEPSKSGVIGLICAALGKPRNEDNRPGLPMLEKLANLKMGVRVDYEGTIERDYHTAGGVHLKKDKDYGVPTADGKNKRPVTSDRFYLADAIFLVALSGDATLLKSIHDALNKPVWQLYLGRKAFVPDASVYLSDGLMADVDDLDVALKSYPYLCPSKRSPPEKLRTEIEVEYGQGELVRQDQPLSFAQRRFGLRHVRTGQVLRCELPQPKEDQLCIFLS